MQIFTTYLTEYQQENTALYIEYINKSIKIKLPFICMTDTIYGLCAPITHMDIVNEIYLIKRRDIKKAFPIIVGSLKQMYDLTDISQHKKINRLSKSNLLTGGNTYLFKGAKNNPEQLMQFQDNQHVIAVRMANRLDLQAALVETAPIVASSANISNTPFISNEKQILNIFRDSVQLFLFDNIYIKKQQSNIYDYTGDSLRKVR